MSYDDPGHGGMLRQVLQSPHQGTLAALEIFGYGNENLVLDVRVLDRLSGAARRSARGHSEAVLCSPASVPSRARGSLHFRSAASWCRKVAVMQCPFRDYALVYFANLGGAKLL
ncbi:hypothetical protein SEVIR_7G208550v4 [Setaria viridis]